MEDIKTQYTLKLYQLASPLFLFLVSFRRKVGKGYPVSIQLVEQDLGEIFRQMEQRSRNDPRLDALYNEAKYPLWVLADEVLLHSEWAHADTWQREHLLEEKFHGTKVGGDELFRRASELSHEQVELAAIYYVAISLGVKGTHHSDPAKLEEIKNKLFRQLSDYLAETKDKLLTPQAYHVQESKARRFSPAITLARVILVGIGLVIIYWLATRVSWSILLSDLRGLVETIITADTRVAWLLPASGWQPEIATWAAQTR